MICMNGIYCLILKIKESIMQDVGVLGLIPFSKGDYAYIGCAKKGMEKRLLRHLSEDKNIHWHIDFLLSNGEVEIHEIYFTSDKNMDVCKIAKKVSLNSVYINGFGASDCSCKSHLFKLRNKDFLKGFKEIDLKKLKIKLIEKNLKSDIKDKKRELKLSMKSRNENNN
jgi:Uri superfamily endonuclease